MYLYLGSYNFNSHLRGLFTKYIRAQQPVYCMSSVQCGFSDNSPHLILEQVALCTALRGTRISYENVRASTCTHVSILVGE